MKRIVLTLLCFFLCSLTYADVPKKIIFFGDSLSDTGNMYKISLGSTPKYPPYFKGRFTNGYTWSDRFAEYYFHKYQATADNYAFGGATVLGAPHTSPNSNSFPPTLREEVQHFLQKSITEDKSKMLFIIWIGANDYFFDTPDVELKTTLVTNEIFSIIQELMSKGASNFLILNIPDISFCPYSTDLPYKEKLHQSSIQHNAKLLEGITKFQQTYPSVKFNFFDIFSLVNDIGQNPDKYNQKYNCHLVNLNEACWKGGYRLSVSKTNSVVLNEAYNINKNYEAGLTPCDHPDEYFFWDHIHPSEVAHNILAQILVGDMVEK